MSSTPSAAKGSSLSLYANLLDPSSTATPGSVSKAPIIFRTPGPGDAEDGTTLSAASTLGAKKSAVDASALRFQPTKRPQLQQKGKSKPGGGGSGVINSLPQINSEARKPNNDATLSSQTGNAKSTGKSTLADWAALNDDGDVNGFYAGEKRQRGGRKRRKKNKEEHVVVQDWDDIYDPSRPNSYEEYKGSEERIREVREWKDRLYAHRMRKHSSSDESEDERPAMNARFAPPSNLSFAPPSTSKAPAQHNADDHYSPELSHAPLPPPPSPPPPPPMDSWNGGNVPLQKSQPPQASTDFTPAATISRAPVRYNLPPAPTDIPRTEDELAQVLAAEERNTKATEAESESSTAERSLVPGQAGFAARLMSKYGWSKGQGLGAKGSGITEALRVQVEKRKKKSDAEGGGWRDRGGRGKIIGGKPRVGHAGDDAGDDEDASFGAMSEVVVLGGMVDGMELDAEISGGHGDDNSGGLMQEIGEECSDKYGNVERVYIHCNQDSSTGARVFVKFTSQLSGLRAVNALRDRIFNGNTITARFYDAEKFASGIYED